MIDLRGADGNRLAADVAGALERPVVLLLHGGGQTRHSWGRTRAVLAEHGYRVFALDARGHGDSDWTPEAGYALDRFAADLRCVIDRIGRRVTLVGASLGGLTALQVLSTDPGLDCAGLVLVDVVPRPNPAGIRAILAFMRSRPDGFASVEEAAQAIAEYLPHRTRGSDPAGLARNLRQRADGRLHWHWDPAFIAGGGPGMRDPEMLERAFQDLDIPVLLVRGGTSDVVTEAELEAFCSLAPRARTADVAGAAHMVAGDRNDAFTAAIIDFLGEVGVG